MATRPATARSNISCRFAKSNCVRAMVSDGSVARNSGVLLPQTSLADAHAVLERLRKRYNQERCAHLPNDASLSVSIGITELSDADTAESLLKRADLALYVAKSGGRDRSEVRSADGTPPFPRQPETTFATK